MIEPSYVIRKIQSDGKDVYNVIAKNSGDVISSHPTREDAVDAIHALRRKATPRHNHPWFK